MLSNWELWACALAMSKRYGDRAPVAVAARIGSLALAGDVAGVETWQAIAKRIEKLRQDMLNLNKGHA
jgi:hypothetical protein